MLSDEKLGKHTGSKEVAGMCVDEPLTSPGYEKESSEISSLTSQPSVFTCELVVSADAKQQSGACWRKFPMCALLCPEEELFVKRRLLGCDCL